MKEHIIYNEEDYLDIDALVEEYRDDYPDEDEDILRGWAEDAADNDIRNEQENLSDIEIPNGILGLGRIGRWWANTATGKDIRPVGYLEYSPATVGECIKHYSTGMSYICAYLDENWELCVREADHDGTSDYVFRAWKKDVSEDEKEELKEKIYMREDCAEDLERLTYALGDEIAKVYGWQREVIA